MLVLPLNIDFLYLRTLGVNLIYNFTLCTVNPKGSYKNPRYQDPKGFTRSLFPLTIVENISCRSSFHNYLSCISAARFYIFTIDTLAGRPDLWSPAILVRPFFIYCCLLVVRPSHDGRHLVGPAPRSSPGNRR